MDPKKKTSLKAGEYLANKLLQHIAMMSSEKAAAVATVGSNHGI